MKEKFKIGDRIIGNGIQNELDITGHKGVIISLVHFYGGCLANIRFDKAFDNRLHGKNYFVVDVNRVILDLNEDELKKREKLRLDHINDDPFGEEIWEHLKRFKDYERDI